jgi:hypothetical protein
VSSKRIAPFRKIHLRDIHQGALAWAVIDAERVGRRYLA